VLLEHRVIRGPCRLVRRRRMLRLLCRTLLILRSLSTCYRFFSIQAILFSCNAKLTPDPYLVTNLTNNHRQGKSFCNQRRCLLPDTESFGKATTLSYSPNLQKELFSETGLPPSELLGSSQNKPDSLHPSTVAASRKEKILKRRINDSVCRRP
jgi:hypothetical protein